MARAASQERSALAEQAQYYGGPSSLSDCAFVQLSFPAIRPHRKLCDDAAGGRHLFLSGRRGLHPWRLFVPTNIFPLVHRHLFERIRLESLLWRASFLEHHFPSSLLVLFGFYPNFLR